MGYGTNGLTFNTLRGANRARLPQFRNKRGARAHSEPDGSDWSPAQWLQALLGELGEFAEVRRMYELGELSHKQYAELAAKELADVQTYLDLTALRSLDTVMPAPDGALDRAQVLMLLVVNLGLYANATKKHDRGDIDSEQHAKLAAPALARAMHQLMQLQAGAYTTPAVVVTAHRSGVDLGNATMDKFNEVSQRVGSNIRIDAEDWHFAADPK